MHNTSKMVATSISSGQNLSSLDMRLHDGCEAAHHMLEYMGGLRGFLNRGGFPDTRFLLSDTTASNSSVCGFSTFFLLSVAETLVHRNATSSKSRNVRCY